VLQTQHRALVRVPPADGDAGHVMEGRSGAEIAVRRRCHNGDAICVAGFVAMGESPDLERAYAWLGLGFAGLTMVVALPTRRDMA
jgi:hypothetical protein